LSTDKFKAPERPVTKPFRLSVNDIFKGTGSGFCVSGRVETGMVQVGDKVLVQPQNEGAVIKGVYCIVDSGSELYLGSSFELRIVLRLFKYWYYDMNNWVGCGVLVVVHLFFLHLKGTIMVHDIYERDDGPSQSKSWKQHIYTIHLIYRGI